MLKENERKMNARLSLARVSIVGVPRQKPDSHSMTLEALISNCSNLLFGVFSTHSRQFWHDNAEQSHHVNSKVRQIIMRVMRAREE